MKKILTLASAVALAAASVSASAWWGGPCTPYGMTQDQQQALAQQQTKAMERMMAAHRQRAEQMAAQQAQAVKRMQAQGMDPMAMGFPGTMDPRDNMGPMDPWDMSMPEYPTMPTMPEYPTMPTMPEPFPTNMPQPPVPAFMQDRYAELEAYRARILEESKARHDKMTRRMAERRRKIEADRFTHPYRSTHAFIPPRTRMTKTPEKPATKPQTVTVPAGVPTALVPKAAPTSATVTDQAVAPTTTPVAPAPAPNTTPVAPARTTTTPQG